MNNTARIVLIDDQRSYGEAIRLALTLTEDLRVIAVEEQPDVGLQRIFESVPDLVVMSYRLRSEQTGLDLVAEIRSQQAGRRSAANVPIVLLTAYPTPGLVRSAKAVPDVSVIAKSMPITELVTGLRCVLGGETVYLGVADDPYALTKAELEVLERLALGQNATAIASDLHLSVHAIRARIRGLLTKTESTSQLESVAKAMSVGIVAPPVAATSHSAHAATAAR